MNIHSFKSKIYEYERMLKTSQTGEGLSVWLAGQNMGSMMTYYYICLKTWPKFSGNPFYPVSTIKVDPSFEEGMYRKNRFSQEHEHGRHWADLARYLVSEEVPQIFVDQNTFYVELKNGFDYNVEPSLIYTISGVRCVDIGLAQDIYFENGEFRK